MKATEAFEEILGYLDTLEAEGSASADVDTLRAMTDTAIVRLADALRACVELPVGRDGVPIGVGDFVYGTDGELWKVVRIVMGADYEVTMANGRSTKTVRASSVYKDRTEMAKEVIRSAISESGGEPLGDEWLTDVTRRALDIRGAS
jgi:hypothetical protein